MVNLGGKQIKRNYFFQWNVECFRIIDVFSYPAGTKGSKIERIMIVQTHVNDGENTRFFLFFQKKAVIN